MAKAQAPDTSSISRLDQIKISQYFGCNTFSERTMRERLQKDVYKAYRQALKRGEALSPEVAKSVALAMKEWALEQGCTHFTHWFLPMTGATAEKHDAFITWDEPGTVIERFSGSQLIQGEPDASSFPSGGLRATFEARGYTAWDPASPAFIMEGPLGKTLCIPTAFVGYHGEALDHKVPLLRSMDVVSVSARKALQHFGVNAESVVAQCGPEQEYFAVDLDLARLRPDLLFANRTLQGARPPKGQEMEDHYFGSIKERVLGFMQDVELECFKLGIPAKTRHNEVAPNQFEIAPIYEAANLASDHNQLLMEILKSVGERHSLAILLHEKPFAGVNGSGKHVNWSIATDEGQNLLEPGNTPEENLQFLYFLSATLKAIHTHGGLLRASIAFAGNDHRLGANEAPPAIMSAFLGAQLNHILDAIEKGDAADASVQRIIDLGIGNLPRIEKDATDRNRTSPFAFTGNKFEFRAVGSSQPIALPLTVINAAVAEALDDLNAKLDAELKAGKEHKAAVLSVVRQAIIETKAIRFEGNGYSEEWKAEAERRGLPHAKDTVAALHIWEEPAVKAVLAKPGILSEGEQESRLHIRHEEYQKVIAIETQVLRQMAETQILPSVTADLGARADSLGKLAAAGISVPETLKAALQTQATLAGEAQARLAAMKAALAKAESLEDLHARTEAFGTDVNQSKHALREVLDALEDACDADLWPLPKYWQLLSPLL
ncbi:MAG: glutamine synthetase III [Geothrix sp.]|uniref:glutamine synthetase III family protein n=1 Tax=Geothrix sp. TaxID=1962974 RepID=UPI00183CD7C4|nr:glutamine synthetase III [Geothrix sp.]NWJ41467.1 glutamine synthetase III [Geothrix sp.]WIL20548.1 MAG: glutamine synthetase III [Geothrix sp.]